jgi:hypothetical protein
MGPRGQLARILFQIDIGHIKVPCTCCVLKCSIIRAVISYDVHERNKVRKLVSVHIRNLDCRYHPFHGVRGHLDDQRSADSTECLGLWPV